MSGRVEILMATYNNDSYLEKMLQSLLAQTCSDYRLIVSDDCSQDASVDILRSYQPMFGGRMDLHVRAEPSGSAKANYAGLMRRAAADHVLFADADDVWDEDKVSRTLSALEDVEAVDGPQTPAYVFSDVRLIDRDGQAIGGSYWRFKRIDPSIVRSLSRLLVCPPMLGCASGANRALVRLATPVPITAVTGHDWWMILVAQVFGRVRSIERPTMSYRLHGANSSAQKEVSLSSYARAPGKAAAVRLGMQLRRLQAQALLDQFGAQLPKESRECVQAFVRTGNQGYLSRRATLVRGRYLYPDLPRNLAMLAVA